MTLALLAVLAAAPAMTVDVDLREAPRRIIHARMTLPASPGVATFVYPKWIPGEHGPTGPIADVAALAFSAAGREARWWRDDVDMYAFHVEVPAGADRVEATLDFLASPPDADGYSSGASHTPHLAVLSWNTVLLYPQGAAPGEITVRATAALPDGWRWGTALASDGGAGGAVSFAPVSVAALVDAPLLAGRFLKEIPLGGAGGPSHALVMAAESEAALAIPPALKERYDRLVAEAGALFGARPYRRYRFLLALSDHLQWMGLEHHESSDNRFRERALVDPELHLAMADLLPHEFVHTWNGKHRRPAGLATRDFQAPMKGRLLWIYEGLTEYLGMVLAARAGLHSAEDFRDELALQAQRMGEHRGRSWRPLEDTAAAAQLLYGARADWSGWRRSVDFYPEGALLWLDVDTLLRERSGGKRSIDDFCRAFFGGVDGAVEVRPYELDEVLAALDQVAPNDWAGFFAARVTAAADAPPLAGVERAGWRLGHQAQPTAIAKALGSVLKRLDLGASLGLFLKAEDGRITDVVRGSPADRAGVMPNAKLVAVNGRRFAPEALAAAVEGSRSTGQVELLVEDADFFRTFVLAYRDGARFAVLRRDEGKPDLLAAIVAPRTQALTEHAAR